MRRSILIPVCLGTLLLASQLVSAAPLAEEYLTSGKLDALPPKREKRGKRPGNITHGDTALSCSPGTMGDAHFVDSQSLSTRLGEHLSVREEPPRFRKNSPQGITSKHLQGTVDITQWGLQKPTNERVIAPRVETAECRVLPIDAKAGNNIVTCGQLKEMTQFRQIKLTVSISEGNQAPPTRLETRS